MARGLALMVLIVQVTKLQSNRTKSMGYLMTDRRNLRNLFPLLNFYCSLIRFKLLVVDLEKNQLEHSTGKKKGHLAEDKDVVGASAPDAGDDEDKEEGGVDEAEVEEDGGGQEPEEGVDELTHHEDGLRLHLVRVVNLTRAQHS